MNVRDVLGYVCTLVGVSLAGAALFRASDPAGASHGSIGGLLAAGLASIALGWWLLRKAHGPMQASE